MKQRRIIVLRVVLTLLSVAAVSFIFYNSSLSAVDSDETSSALTEAINRFLQSLGIGIECSDHFIRKTAHFVEFFVLGSLLCATVCAYVPRRRVMLLSTLPAGLAVAVTDELIQTGSAGRSCQWTDVALDFSAVVTAALVAALILTLRGRKKRKNDGNKEGNRNE